MMLMGRTTRFECNQRSNESGGRKLREEMDGPGFITRATTRRFWMQRSRVRSDTRRSGLGASRGRERGNKGIVTRCHFYCYCILYNSGHHYHTSKGLILGQCSVPILLLLWPGTHLARCGPSCFMHPASCNVATRATKQSGRLLCSQDQEKQIQKVIAFGNGSGTHPVTGHLLHYCSYALGRPTVS